MNTKYLMILSSLMTGFAGVVALFLPKEILNGVGQTASDFSVLIIQVSGALYLGFAMMNWMAKTVLIGGIYSRPVSMGNFIHFGIAAIALIKVAMSTSGIRLVWLTAIIYSVFAILFGIVLFTSPFKENN